MGDLYDAPNQQVVRADGSGPADEGTGGSTGEPAEPDQQQVQAEQAQQTEQQQPPEKPAGRRKRSAEDPVLPDRQTDTQNP